MLNVMKKLCFLPLILLLLVCLGATAFAANLPGQQTIIAVMDGNGYVTNLTDDDATTSWTQSSHGAPDLTLSLYSASVGEIWIRSGYAYTQNWYNHYDRPDVVKVTVYYQANRYTESYDMYRYRLMDEFRPNTVSANWNSGYQRLLLPKQYQGVTKIELTIESAITGFGKTGATISDIIVTGGSHATATPKAYATATPKPYVVYVTPTPGPETDDDDVVFITPVPDEDDDDSLVELITPAPRPTATPEIVVITPTPAADPIEYPSLGGIIATLSSRAATRSGPSNRFDEPGSFFSEGAEVKVISKSWDNYNDLWWLQIEFQYRGEWYRAYTTENRVNVNLSLVPEEPTIGDPIDSGVIQQQCKASFGPGKVYRVFGTSVLHEGNKVDIYAIENGWVQIEYTDYGSNEDPQPRRRGWVPINCVYGN